MRLIALDRGRVGGVETRRAPVRVAGVGEPALAAAGAVLCALTAVVTISGSPADYAWLEGLARASSVGAPIGVGLYALRRPAFRRFGTLLVATGVVVFLSTLAEASSPQVYAFGRIAGWAIEPLLLYLILAFPSGHLTSRFDRAFVMGGVLIAVTLFLPTALVVERFPEPSQWTSCHAGCPANAFMLTASEPALIEDVVRPLRELLLVLLLVAVTTRVALRIRGSSPLMRRTLAPVLSVAILRLVSFAGLMVLRRAAPDSAVLSVCMWALPLGVTLLAVAFLVGLARWWVFTAAAVKRLAARLTSHPGPEELRGALAEAFDDPGLEIVYWQAPVGWADADGRPVPVPGDASTRCLTEIRDGDQPVAAIVHDEALRGEPAFLDAVTAYAVMTLDNHRLSTEAAAMLAEVQDSRARIQATADEERRRIERDLHDGAQQRLVGLRIQLELAAERINGSDNGRSAALFRKFGADVDGALEDVRSLARGIYPAPLADYGLAEGLRSAARHAALPIVVHANGVQPRYPQEIESAAYFCCLEAAQNAAKHGGGATAVVIDLTDNGVLRFEVRDDGAGFDVETAPVGMGMTSMRDRLAAVAGELAIVSSPGHGTRVIGRIPLHASTAPGPAVP